MSLDLRDLVVAGTDRRRAGKDGFVSEVRLLVVEVDVAQARGGEDGGCEVGVGGHGGPVHLAIVGLGGVLTVELDHACNKGDEGETASADDGELAKHIEVCACNTDLVHDVQEDVKSEATKHQPCEGAEVGRIRTDVVIIQVRVGLVRRRVDSYRISGHRRKEGHAPCDGEESGADEAITLVSSIASDNVSHVSDTCTTTSYIACKFS